MNRESPAHPANAEDRMKQGRRSSYSNVSTRLREMPPPAFLSSITDAIEPAVD
jgi:hypothetical protein